MITWAIAAASVALGAWEWRRELLLKRGEKAFLSGGCAVCHLAGAAPSITKAGGLLRGKRLKQFLADPDSIYRERGMQPLVPGYPRMAKPKVEGDDLDAIAAYVRSVSER
ncbi:MAG TPA: c-type cytochrome [Myxococcales bacterium]|nr:c-type cytochrome [Myxococcales bacterium]